jgi:hypothetical protein
MCDWVESIAKYNASFWSSVQVSKAVLLGVLPLSYRGKKKPLMGIEPITSRLTADVCKLYKSGRENHYLTVNSFRANDQITTRATIDYVRRESISTDIQMSGDLLLNSDITDACGNS